MKFITQLSSPITRFVKEHAWTRPLAYSKNHKLISSIILVAVATGGYYGYQAVFGAGTETRYVLTRATIGELKTTIVGTGQVSASNQIDLKPKASGTIVRVNAKVGQEMKAGQLIAQIDNRDVALSLESARLSLQKLTKPADSATIIQAQNSLEDAMQSKLKAEAALAKSYEDGLTAVSTSFIDLPTIIIGMNNLFYTRDGFLSDTSISTLPANAQSYRTAAGSVFDIAQNDYKSLQEEYRLTARSNSTSTTEALILKTYALVSKLGESLKNSALATDYIRSNTNDQLKVKAAAALTDINGWTAKNNSNLNGLISAKTAIENAKSDISTATRNIKERTESLAKIMQGTDALDIRSQQLSISQKELEYDKYNIRAPFDGILAKLDVKVGDSASDSVGIFITKQKVADITLNEVDIANVQVGQAVELTFDAVEDVVATGTVASVDLVGTVTQGVVNYTTQIAFQTSDDRIKPGMSVSATIITKNKENVLLVPTSAVKSKSGGKYVEVATMENFNNGNPNGSSTVRMRDSEADQASSTIRGTTTRSINNRAAFSGAGAMNQNGIILSNPPIERTVTVGESNETSVEILEGLKAGEFVVTRTIANATTTKAANSLFGAPRTGGAGAAGGTRIR